MQYFLKKIMNIIFSDGLFHNSNQNIAHVCQAYQTTTKKRLKQVSVKELGLES